MRHPAEVATSKVALAHWNWFGDIERYMEDPIVRRELTGLSHLILAATTPFRRHVVHWAASHRYFFSEVAPRSLPIIRYPGAREDMADGVEQVLATLGQRESICDPSFDIAWRTRSATGLAHCEKNLFRRAFHRARPSRRDLAFAERVIDAFCLRWLVPWTAFADAPVASPAVGARVASGVAANDRRAFGF